MTPYAICLGVGAVGMVAMAASGLSHGHGGTHGGHDAHLGTHGGSHGNGHAGHDAGHHGEHYTGHAESAVAAWAASLLSPRVLFTLLVGFGATGLLLRPLLAAPLVAVCAVVGGLAFELLAARPLWNLFARFGSKPAATLESCIADEAKAVTGFDASGHGLVAIELDGQIVQLLAALGPADRAAGVRIRAGDRVRIDDVDPTRNRCTVSALGAR